MSSNLDPKSFFLTALFWAGTAVLALFPAWSYFFIPVYGLSAAACTLIVAAFVRILWKPSAFTGLTTMMTAVIGIATAITQSVTVLKFWPVALAAMIIIGLASGLGKDTGWVASDVAKTSGRLTEASRAYSRSLSLLWIVFFTAIGAVAVLTCFWGNMKSWAFWNGGAAWVTGLVFYGSERLVRSCFLRTIAKH